jgi:hypothetical protein
LVTKIDGGAVGTDYDLNAPTCGASSFEPKQVVVDKVVDVPMDVTEEVTEQVTEEVPEQVTETVTTTKPTTLYIMFDKSLSMAGAPYGPSDQWTPAVSALKSFVKDDASAGLGVALQYFPLSGSNGGNCGTGGGYSTPAVAAATLPGTSNATINAFSTSLDNHSADGLGTPIEGALRGVTEYCKTFQNNKPGEQCVAVLVTDGKPEFAGGCSEDSTKLASIAKDAHALGVTTFAVGLKGADFALLDKIAQQGGAPDCEPSSSTYACDVSGGADKLSVALNAIRDTVVTTEVHTETVSHIESSTLPCTWEIPTPPKGQIFDRDKVNIRFTTPSGATTFARVPSSEDCRDNGWHFDNFSAPTKLLACPQTCDHIKATPEAKIDVLLGCATVILTVQ